MDDARIGTTLQDRYRVDRKLGEGGMGAVYEGEHLLIGRRVAIKFLHRELATDSDAVARFMREAKTATSIQHKNIVEVTDMAQADDGALYMVLEYLEGRDWAEELARSGQQPVAKVVHIIRQVCDALTAAHAGGVIHRDLKPENIFLVERDGDPDFVKVVDFGISKMVGDDNSMTKTGMVLGTPYFMSPEQARDSKTVDLRADLYSVGVMLFHALTQRFPFEADTYGSLVVQICTEKAPSARDLRPDVPKDLARIVDVLLAKDPVERYQSAKALKKALAPFGAHQGSERAALGFAPTGLAPSPKPLVSSEPDPLVPIPAPLASAPRPAMETPAIRHVEAAPKAPPKPPGRILAFAMLGVLVSVGVGAGVVLLQADGVPAMPVPESGTTMPSKAPAEVLPLDPPVEPPAEVPVEDDPNEVRPASSIEDLLGDVERASMAGAGTAEPGSLRVASRPHSDVFIDGEAMGHTPLRLPLAAGRHRVELRSPSGEVYRRNLTIVAGEASNLMYRFDQVETNAASGGGSPATDEEAPAAAPPERLGPSAIRPVIARARGSFRNCYERALRTNPELAGRVDLRVRVEPSGRVGEVSVQRSTLDSAEVEECMVRAARRLRFPASESGITFTHPTHFRAN